MKFVVVGQRVRVDGVTEDEFGVLFWRAQYILQRMFDSILMGQGLPEGDYILG